MKIVKNAAFVGTITLISRIFGYFRDIVIAYSLGASILNDIFVIVLRLPNIFRSIFAEGAFSAAFIPIFNKLYQRGGHKAAYDFACLSQSILIISLLIFTMIIIIFMPYIIKFTAPGFGNQLDAINLMINLSRVTFPYIIFISLMAFYGGITNSLGNYFAFASAPIILNVVLLIAAFIGEDKIDKIFSLSYGTLIAGILEMLWVLYFVYKKFSLPKLVWPKIDDNVKFLFKKILPGIFSSGVNQINIFVSTIIASYTIGGISYLYYADRIYQLPLAIIGTAFGIVLLPELSKTLALNKLRKTLVVQNQAMIMACFITLPMTAFIFLFAKLIVKVLFEYGAFTHEATMQTAAALAVFSFCIPAYVFNKILINIFFANEDTKTPFKISLIALGLNILISIVMLPYCNHVAVAIGAVVSAWFNVYMQIHILYKNKKYEIYNNSKKKLMKIFLILIFSILTTVLCEIFITFNNPVVKLISLSLIGGCTYIGLAHTLKIYKITKIFKKDRSKF